MFHFYREEGAAENVTSHQERRLVLLVTGSPKRLPVSDRGSSQERPHQLSQHQTSTLFISHQAMTSASSSVTTLRKNPIQLDQDGDTD